MMDLNKMQQSGGYFVKDYEKIEEIRRRLRKSRKNRMKTSGEKIKQKMQRRNEREDEDG